MERRELQADRGDIRSRLFLLLVQQASRLATPISLQLQSNRDGKINLTTATLEKTEETRWYHLSIRTGFWPVKARA
ncbi:MAG: hypothetical protein ACE5HO_14530 [bacterium]